MSNTKLGFFCACPKQNCKKKFMVEPRFLKMYLTRLRGYYDEKGQPFPGVFAMLDAAQNEIKPQKKEG